jgi:hypothetical protein
MNPTFISNISYLRSENNPLFNTTDKTKNYIELKLNQDVNIITSLNQTEQSVLLQTIIGGIYSRLISGEYTELLNTEDLNNSFTHSTSIVECNCNGIAYNISTIFGKDLFFHGLHGTTLKQYDLLNELRNNCFELRMLSLNSDNTYFINMMNFVSRNLEKNQIVSYLDHQCYWIIENYELLVKKFYDIIEPLINKYSFKLNKSNMKFEITDNDNNTVSFMQLFDCMNKQDSYYLIILLYTLLTLGKPVVLLLDLKDNTLPSSLITELLSINKNLQIIITTSNPNVFDNYNTEKHIFTLS